MPGGLRRWPRALISHGAEFIASNYSDLILWQKVKSYEVNNNNRVSVPWELEEGGARPFRGSVIRTIRPHFERALSVGRHPVAALGVTGRDWSESKDSRLRRLRRPTCGLGDRLPRWW